jgi:hypothetical protein
MAEYHVKCPKCGKKAVMKMRPEGIRGTYREQVSNMVPEKMICHSCGYASEPDSANIIEYEFWYKASFKDRFIWAYNRDHLCFLVNWLSGDFEKKELTTSEKAYVETLPKWMNKKKNRAEIIHRFKRMLSQD